jgi:hypothetical protein
LWCWLRKLAQVYHFQPSELYAMPLADLAEWLAADSPAGG